MDIYIMYSATQKGELSGGVKSRKYQGYSRWKVERRREERMRVCETPQYSTPPNHILSTKTKLFNLQKNLQSDRQAYKDRQIKNI